ncbi:MAG: glutamate synthase [Phycisphaerae bacterium]|nr:glutamate synthase [Phycisphaerae bacterium]
MAELVPAPFSELVHRVVLELRSDDAVFLLPRRKWWTPDPDGPNLSVRFHENPAGTPVGPAAGPHTQMAQNLVLSWLAGSRILELKTVQINDRLKIGRPCIDATNIGYNIEWSQELRIQEALREYVAGWMLIQMLARGGLLSNSPIASHATETIFDLSVGYDLAGIRSSPVTSFIQSMRDASAWIEQLRREIPREYSALRDMHFPAKIATSITLSTFHGCPADEIERICEYLIAEMDCDVVIKMNPPMLGKDRLEHLLHDVMGYEEIRVPDHAYVNGLQFDESLRICERLTRLAAMRGRRLGAKFSNTLEVENHRTFFSSDNKTQYLSGQPLHVITLTLADEFRKAVGPEFPLTFSAGVDRQNFTSLVAAGFRPITTCTDLLRPGGYGRLPPYLSELSAAMRRLNASCIEEFIDSSANASTSGTEHLHGAAAAAANLSAAAAAARADARYRADANRKTPKRIGTHLTTFDCVTCDKCIPVCPNAANFVYSTDAVVVEFTDYRIVGNELRSGDSKRIVVEKAAQIANFADFCNDCGNCDTFCPEYDGPFIKKPNFFGSHEAWRRFDHRDGFFIDLANRCTPQVFGRIQGNTYLLARESGWEGMRFEDGIVCLFVHGRSHEVERWFAFGPADASGHIVNMTAYHTMRILIDALLKTDRVHQINAGYIAERREGGPNAT